MNARFDDLVSGWAVACPPPRRVLVAERPGEVAAVLAEVEASGSWAYGFVSYEAAPGFDDRLPAYPRGDDEPPLAWFGLCDEPVPVPVIAPSRPGHTRWALDWSEGEHRRAVEAVRKHIAAG